MIGEIASLAAALVWAIASLMVKQLSPEVRPIALQGLRCVATTVFFALILLATGKFALFSQISFAGALGLVLGTFIGIGIGESLITAAYRHIDVSQAYPISISGYPLITSLLAISFLGERLSWGTLLGAALVIAGTYLVAFPRSRSLLPSLSSNEEKKGLLLVFLTIVSWGIATLVIKVGLGNMDIILASFIRISGTTLLLLPLAFRPWRDPHTRGNRLALLALSALSGILSFGVGGMLLLVGIRYAGVAKTSILSATSPLFLVPLAMFFFKEKITTKLVLGIVLSISGIWLIVG